MKYRWLALILIVCLFSACSKNQNFETDYKVYEVSGSVRQVIYKNAETRQNEIVATFNKDGLLLTEQNRSSNFYYHYNGKYITELNVFLGDSLEIKRSYKYTKDLPTEIREYDKSGTFRKKVLYEYDGQGNRIKGIILTPFNDTNFIWSYKFENEKVIQEERINFANKPHSVQVFNYEYDSLGNLSSITEMSGLELQERTLYKTYNNVSLQVKSYRYWDNQIYDSVSMSYLFDNNGNWILKKTKTKRAETNQERTIVYY